MATGESAQAVPMFTRDGGTMPVLGLGTFQCSGTLCRKAVRTALELGYRHVDTARMYGNEVEVGQGIKDAGIARDTLFLTTKLQRGQLDSEGVRRSCADSLKSLGTDYVDLLLIHWPEREVPLAETLGAMADLRREGRIRHLGFSNFTGALMEEAVTATDAPIFCNQVEYHPYLRQDLLLRCCRDRGIVFVAYSPLARGRVHNDERLADIGRKHGKTPAQVVLRWVLSEKDIVTIPKASSEAHIRENLDVFDFELDDEDLAIFHAIEDNQRLIDPPWAPEWDA